MIACGWYAELRDGRTFWVPPTGRPYWTHCQPTVYLTDEEILTYLGRKE